MSGLLAVLVSLWPMGFPSDVVWAKSYSTGVALAAKGKKPMLLFVSGPAAAQFEERIFQSPRVQDRLSKFVCIKVDATAEKAKALGARAPSFYFLETGGAVLCRVQGFLGPDSFELEVDRAEENLRDWPGTMAALKRNSNDGAANARHAGLLANRGELAKAQAALSRALKAGYGGGELARANNAIGDEYQIAGNFDEAIKCFTRADKAGGRLVDKAYALVSLTSCHRQKGNPAGAAPFAKRLLSLKGAPTAYLDFANQALHGATQPARQSGSPISR